MTQICSRTTQGLARSPMRGLKTILSISLSLALMSACVEEASPPAMLDQGDCPQGKCDRVSDNVQELYSDMKRLNLDDLVSLGAGLATDELNGVLSQIPYIDLKLSETAVFGSQPRVLFGETMIDDIYKLQAGLTTGLGETAFATRINGLRLRTLENTPAEVFAETSFKLGGSLNQSWSLVRSNDKLGTLGFTLAPNLEAIVIAPYANPSEAIVTQPLRVLQEARGFVLPRDLTDILNMAPGSSVTLRGEGVVGLNLGVGVPLVATAIAEFLSLSARLSAAARVSISGDLDIQLVRGADKTAYLDVGLTEQRVKHLSVALNSGYGVEGLPIPELDVGGIRVDLAKVLGEAFERQLNDKLGLFDAQRSSTQVSGRLSVARFEFDLSSATPSVVQAINQGMRGDLRLAQALAIRDRSGVTRHLELTKEFELDSKYLGFRLLSMRFFSSTSESRGNIHIGTAGERQELLFDEIERKGGFFFTERGSNWRQTTSTISNDLGEERSLNNARLIVTEHDNYLSKDQINDHLDALLAYFYGFDPIFSDVGFAADQLGKYADHNCGPRPNTNDSIHQRRSYDRCVENLPYDQEYRDLLESVFQRSSYYDSVWSKRDFSAGLTSSHEIGQQLLATRVGISGIHYTGSGPEGTLVTQVRFSDQGVESLMAPDAPQRFTEALRSVMALMDLDRDDDLDDRVDETESYLRNKERRINAIESTYERLVKRYQQFSSVADLTWRDGQPVSEEAMLLLVPANAEEPPALYTLAQLKGQLVGTLYGELLDTARRLGEPDTLLIGYTLLYLVAPSEAEVMFSGRFEEGRRGAYHDYNFNIYSQGDADFIEAGVFDLEELLGSKSL